MIDQFDCFCSAYQLHLSESHSSVSLYSGWDLSEFDTITHIPIKASNDYYTLSDIIANDQTLHGEHVNIQAVVKHVSLHWLSCFYVCLVLDTRLSTVYGFTYAKSLIIYFEHSFIFLSFIFIYFLRWGWCLVRFLIVIWKSSTFSFQWGWKHSLSTKVYYWWDFLILFRLEFLKTLWLEQEGMWGDVKFSCLMKHACPSLLSCECQ